MDVPRRPHGQITITLAEAEEGELAGLFAVRPVPQELYLGLRRNAGEYPRGFLSDARNRLIIRRNHYTA